MICLIQMNCAGHLGTMKGSIYVAVWSLELIRRKQKIRKLERLSSKVPGNRISVRVHANLVARKSNPNPQVYTAECLPTDVHPF